MNHMKESLHSRLFSAGIVLMVVAAVVAGSWIHAVVLVAGLSAHELVRRWDVASAARGRGSAQAHS